MKLDDFHFIFDQQDSHLRLLITRDSRVVALGARGAGAGAGAHGGRVYAIIPVTPGEQFAVFVGGEGREQAVV